MPPVPSSTLSQLQTNADQASAALAAAKQRIAEASAEVRAAADAHLAAVLAAIQPHPQPPADALTAVDEAEQRLKKALATWQRVCRDLGV